jgi:hypothetical protein
LITAKCNKCGAISSGNDFADARLKMNHAVGLSRGIKCGDNYNQVYEIKLPPPAWIKPTPEPAVETKVEKKVETETPQESEKPKETEKPKSKSKSIKSKFKMK